MIEGAYLAKKTVIDYLAQDIPTRLIAYRTHWGLTEDDLEDPVKYLRREPLAIDEWPTIYITTSNSQSTTRVDYDSSGNPEYKTVYVARTFLWVAAVNEQPTVDARDRMTAVVKDALLDHPSLVLVGEEPDCALVVIDETTMREEYSDVSPLKGDRYMAGAYLSYDLAVQESVERADVGTAVEFLLNVSLMERVPNAPAYVLGEGGDESGSINLWWKAPTWNGEDGVILGYKIEVSDDGEETWSTVTSDTESRVPRYTVADLVPEGAYQFRVSGFNSAGMGAASSPSLTIVATE